LVAMKNLFKILPLVFFIILILQVIPVWAKSQEKTAFAVTGDGEVFLMIPSSEKKIHHINQRGVIVNRFGEEGPGEGEILAPIDMLLWKEKLYILDLFGPQIKIFSKEGKPLGTIGKDFPKEQQMSKPFMMRIHHDDEKESDFIYTLDLGKHLITVFSLDGKYMNGISLNPDYEKYFEWMTSFNIDDEGNFWFTTDSLEDIALRHVLVFRKDGTLLKELSMSKTARGGFLTDIIPLPEGEFMVADSALSTSSSAYTGALILFDSKGEPKDKKTIYDNKTSRFYSPRRVTLSTGGIYVLSSEDRLLHLDNNFEVLHSWSLQ